MRDLFPRGPEDRHAVALQHKAVATRKRKLVGGESEGFREVDGAVVEELEGVVEAAAGLFQRQRHLRMQVPTLHTDLGIRV